MKHNSSNRFISMILAVLLVINGTVGYMPQTVFGEMTDEYAEDNAVLLEEDEGVTSVEEDEGTSVYMIEESADLIEDRMAAQDNSGVNSPKLSIKPVSGGDWHEEDSTFIWKADSTAAGHRFLFSVHYDMSGEGSHAPGTVSIRVPLSIIRDNDNKEEAADKIELPYPRVTKEEYEALISQDSEAQSSSSTEFVYYIEDDCAVVINAKSISAGTIGDFDVVYETTKKTPDYRDYGCDGSKSRPFYAELRIDNDTPLRSNDMYVGIDTSATINAVNKGFPTLYYQWDNSWGTEPETEGEAEANYYLIWEIRSTVWNPTQYYSFCLTDTMDKEYGDVVGFRLAGEKGFTPVQQEENGEYHSNTVAHQNGAGYRYDYVLTRHPRNYFEQAPDGHLRIQNRIKADLTPEDGVDAPTSAISTRIYDYYGSITNFVGFRIPLVAPSAHVE